ncbi:MAG TPA: glutamine-synthetase adenylyltransferase, partial [Caulobacteraceae bacterium]|nr:glutamine-synthetase adenylyltransferase [Caulobacteraceae bacterium]
MLADRLRPCGPVLDRARADDLLDSLGKTAAETGWSGALAAATDALRPVFGASPYLASLARRYPGQLGQVLTGQPQDVLAAILTEAGQPETTGAPAAQRLRRAKADLHLLTALCDLGGVWDLDQVTDALTRFADVAVAVALAEVARKEVEAGRLRVQPGGGAGPIAGLFCIAMGKYG